MFVENEKIICPLVLLAVIGLQACSKANITYEGNPIARDTLVIMLGNGGAMKSLADFGLDTENSPSENRDCLQNAIDWASASGSALYLPPTETGFKVSGGLVLKRNVSIYGSHNSTGGHATANASGDGPCGSTFVITDQDNTFMTLESATTLSGIQFYYPNQTATDASKIIEYKPTLKLSNTSGAQGVTLMDLGFYGEYTAMDFLVPSNCPCEQILVKDCFGFPLSGIFCQIRYCYDIPRILHSGVCHHNQEAFGKVYSKEVLDAVTSSGNYPFWFDNIDNLVIMDISVDCGYGGIYIGGNTYGQLTGFSFTNVREGIHRVGGGMFNRTWMIADGFISPNIDMDWKKNHAIIVEGYAFTSLTNVSSYASRPENMTNSGKYADFLYVNSTKTCEVAVAGCAMDSYSLDSPISANAPLGQIRVVNCSDNGSLYNAKFN